MLVEVKVPVLSESVADASLVDWHKKVGDHVSQDENLVELETDKVVLEIPAPEEGVLKEIKKIGGTTVLSSEVIAVIDTDAKGATDAKSETAGERPTADVVSLASAAERESAANITALTEEKFSPAARKLAIENNLDMNLIQGTGKDERVTKEDVLRHLASALAEQIVSANIPSPVVRNNPPEIAPQQDRPAVVQSNQQRSDKRVPMTRLRARIAERLKQAQNTAAILTTFNEVNMQPVMALRKRYQEKFTSKYDVKLGFMSFFIKAAIEALKKYPVINASVDGADIIYHDYFDIGIAVSSPRGLVVPVLRNADSQSFAGLETSIINYARAAKDGSLSMDDLMGGTFTITNGGVFGSLLSTPILNPPQSAILGMHSTQERPVVENGEIVIRPMMNLALSYDHRIVDGHEAVLFLVAIKEALEDPTRMLLQV